MPCMDPMTDDSEIGPALRKEKEIFERGEQILGIFLFSSEFEIILTSILNLIFDSSFLRQVLKITVFVKLYFSLKFEL